MKTRFSDFYDSNLDNILRRLNIDTLFIAGYSSDVCVRMTTLDAYNRGYHLYLLADCVQAARENTQTSIENLCWLTNLNVISLNELSSKLEMCH